jgi:YdaS antitoxin of YdaST toxin-antitoxin system
MATETEKRRMSQAVAHACGSVGGQAALARTIGRPEEAVAEWANGKSLVDPELVVEIERITGVLRHEPERDDQAAVGSPFGDSSGRPRGWRSAFRAKLDQSRRACLTGSRNAPNSLVSARLRA